MSRFTPDLRDGFTSYTTAWQIIREKRLWFYFVVPGIISLLFGGLVIYLAIQASGSIRELVESWYPWDNARGFVTTVAAIMSGVLVTAFGLIIYKYVVLILVAPFMSLLSETVENYLTDDNESLSFSIGRAIKEMLRGIRVALRNILREIFFTIILFFVGFIPVVGFISAPAIFILQAYYAGFGNMDFTLERHYGVRGSVRFVRANRGLAIGNGTVFLLILMIPVLGLFIAPGLATVAGAVETVRRLDDYIE